MQLACPPFNSRTLHLGAVGSNGVSYDSNALGCVPILAPPLTAQARPPPALLAPQVAEWLLTSAAPVLYWEQGHEWLFGDPVRLQVRPEAGRAASPGGRQASSLSAALLASALPVPWKPLHSAQSESKQPRPAPFRTHQRSPKSWCDMPTKVWRAGPRPAPPGRPQLQRPGQSLPPCHAPARGGGGSERRGPSHPLAGGWCSLFGLFCRFWAPPCSRSLEYSHQVDAVVCRCCGERELTARADHPPTRSRCCRRRCRRLSLPQEFGRTSLLLHNGVDSQRFCPGPRSTVPPTSLFTAPDYVASWAGHSKGWLRRLRRVNACTRSAAKPNSQHPPASSTQPRLRSLLPRQARWVQAVMQLPPDPLIFLHRPSRLPTAGPSPRCCLWATRPSH